MGHVHSDEIGERSGLHFLHNSRAMNLDGSLADAQFIGDDLVWFSGNHQIKDFAFALCEFIESARNFGVLLLRFASNLIGGKRFMNAVQQFLVAKRFLDKVHSTFLHGFDGHWHIAVTGNENNRQLVAAFDEYLLKFQTSESRHSDIKDQAAWPLFGDLLKKFIRRGENFVRKTDRLHQRLHRDANRGIVIDDKYRRLWGSKRCHW